MSDIQDRVVSVLIEALQLDQRPEQFSPETAMFGALPELDSMGVVVLVVALEAEFDIAIDDSEFGAELFETLGSLTTFVESKSQ